MSRIDRVRTKVPRLSAPAAKRHASLKKHDADEVRPAAKRQGSLKKLDHDADVRPGAKRHASLKKYDPDDPGPGDLKPRNARLTFVKPQVPASARPASWATVSVPFNASTMFQLTDGRILCQEENSPNWWAL